MFKMKANTIHRKNINNPPTYRIPNKDLCKIQFPTAEPQTDYLTEAFCRDELQDDGFHCRHVAEAYLRNVERTNHMSPGTIVSFFEGAILAGAQLTSL